MPNQYVENRPLYSAEITEIIGTPPRWILRAGGGLLLVVLLVVGTLASTVRIAEQHTSPVRITGVTRPYYLRQPTLGGVRPLVASGQVVALGQVLAQRPHDPASRVLAPFGGTVYYEDLAGAPALPGDTLAMLVPLANTYRFRGKVLLAQVPALRRGQLLQIQVPLDSRMGSSLALHGRLRYLNPVVRDGQVSYSGRLDSLSEALLSQQAATITDLRGTLLVRSPSRPVLQRLLQ